MAGFGDIPIPKQFSSMGELADLMMNKRKMQQEKYLEEMRNAQRVKEAEEMAKYHKGMLGVSQSAESRAQKLLPHELLKHQQEEDMFKQFMSGMTSPEQAPDAGTNGTNMGSGMGGGMGGSPEMGGGGAPNAPQMMGQQAPEMQQGAQPPMQQEGQQPGMLGQEKQQPQQPSLQTLKMGQGMTVRPPSDPRKAMWDRAAGMTIRGIKIPDIKTHTADGIEYRTYPSGKMEAFKVGPNAEEKASLAIDAAQQKEEGKIRAKQSQDLVNEGRLVSKFASHVAGINDLLEKNKGISGYKEAGKKFIGQGSEYAGEFSAHQVPLVGSLAKEMSKAGGAVVSRLAQASKPQLHQKYDYNKALTNTLMKDAYRGWKDLKNNYEQMNPGKEYPEKLPKAFDKVKLKTPDGKTFIKSEAEANKFKAEHPELEIEGNIYDEQ